MNDVCPTVTAGPLRMLHDFARACGTSPTATDAARHVRRGLVALQQEGYVGIVCNIPPDNYLHDDEAWSFFNLSLQQAHELGLRCWLYDEEGYPSGTAGGQVLCEHPQLEAVGLIRHCDDLPAGSFALPALPAARYGVAAYALTDHDTQAFTPALRDDGSLAGHLDTPATLVRYVCRSAFEGTHAALNVHAVRRYINVLEPAAVERFRRLTYDAYLQRAPAVATCVEAVFTDEPSLMTTYHVPLPERFAGQVRVQHTPDPAVPAVPMLPWWSNLPAAFAARHGYDVLQYLHLLFSDSHTDPAALRVRQDFYELISRQYTDNYAGRLQGTLNPHGIQLTGHLLHEETLWHHAATQGDSLRVLQAMQRPGCDLLSCRPARIVGSTRLLTATWPAAAALLNGSSHALTELCDWEEYNDHTRATLPERRATVGLLCAQGITDIASYLSWEDATPAEVRAFHEGVARLCNFVYQGTPLHDVAVLYPIRTVWSRLVPQDTPAWLQDPATRPTWLQTLEQTALQLVQQLYAHQRSFSWIDEAGLARATFQQQRLHCGNLTAAALVLLPGALLPEPVARQLSALREQGLPVLAFAPEPQILQGTTRQGRTVPWHTQAAPLPRLKTDSDAGGATLLQHLPPGVQLQPAAPAVYIRAMHTATARHWLLVNTGDQPWQGELHLPGISSASLSITDPWTSQPAASTPLTLEPYGARLCSHAAPPCHARRA